MTVTPTDHDGVVIFLADHLCPLIGCRSPFAHRFEWPARICDWLVTKAGDR